MQYIANPVLGSGAGQYHVIFVTDEKLVVFQPIVTFATRMEVVLSVIHYTTSVLKILIIS